MTEIQAMAWRLTDGERIVVVRCRSCGWMDTRRCREGETPETLGRARTLAEAHPCPHRARGLN